MPFRGDLVNQAFPMGPQSPIPVVSSDENRQISRSYRVRGVLFQWCPPIKIGEVVIFLVSRGHFRQVETSKLGMPMRPEEPFVNGALPTKIGKSVIPDGSAEALSNGVLPMKYSDLVIPMGFEGAPSTGVLPIKPSKLVIPTGPAEAPMRRSYSEEN